LAALYSQAVDFRASYGEFRAISTPLYGKLGIPEGDLKAVSASIQNRVPAGRFGNASEIAHATVFLASDEAPFTVGSELQIDGGMGTL
jgi:NAD(P)-dependent dehydrogenase (short-subunit alcohol dehydrogenase family)